MSAGGATRRLLPVASFTGAYLALALIGAVASGNSEFLFYLGIMAVLVVAVAGVDRAVRLSPGALWGLSAWGLAHMIGGLVPAPPGWPVAGAEGTVVYNAWIIPGRLKYDQIVHAWGFGITTWVCWQGLRAALRARGADAVPTAGLLVLAAAGGMGFGALNEVIEFVATLLVPDTNVGGYRNTGWDLVANLVGATTAVLLIRWRAGAGDRTVAGGRHGPAAPSTPSDGQPRADGLDGDGG